MSMELFAEIDELRDVMAKHLAALAGYESTRHNLDLAETSILVYRAIIRQLEENFRKVDDPTFDATDGAHPAWWRGHDYVSARFKEELDKARRERDLFRARLVDVMPWVGCCPYPGTQGFTEMTLVRDLAQDALDEVPRRGRK